MKDNDVMVPRFLTSPTTKVKNEYFIMIVQILDRDRHNIEGPKRILL